MQTNKVLPKITPDLLNKILNIRDIETGKTLLTTAVQYKKFFMIDLLLGQRNTKVNIIDRDENTPLHYAVQNGDGATLIELLRRGADIMVKNNEKKSPLDIYGQVGERHIFLGLIDIFNHDIAKLKVHFESKYTEQHGNELVTALCEQAAIYNDEILNSP